MANTSTIFFVPGRYIDFLHDGINAIAAVVEILRSLEASSAWARTKFDPSDRTFLVSFQRGRRLKVASKVVGWAVLSPYERPVRHVVNLS
jgi:hypothetical protein